MPTDPLAILMRLRKTELDDARRSFGESLSFVDEAQAERRAADAAIVTETAAAGRSAEDADVERFARWLPRGKARLARAELALAEAECAADQRRAALNLTRAAVDAVQSAMDRANEASTLAAARAEQRFMDEVGQGLSKARRRPLD